MKTTKKEVSEKIQAHILDYFEERGVEQLGEQLEAVKYGNMSDRQGLEEIVKGGTLLIYDEDIKEFLDGLGINPEGKEYDTMESLNLYAHLIAREGLRMLKK